MLIDPDSRSIRSIGGSSVVRDHKRGHDEGLTSLDAAGNKLWRPIALGKLYFVDPESTTIFRTLPLGGGPDYVRFVESTAEA